MALELIGAGMGRTGTLSLKAALERIGYGPCYHGIEVFVAPERGRLWLEQTQSGSHDWDGIFHGYRATVDWPAAAFWRELVERYPDAKVLLSLRDSDRWYDSVMNTLYPVMTQGPPEECARDPPQVPRDAVRAGSRADLRGPSRRSRPCQACIREAQPVRHRCDPGLEITHLPAGRRMGAHLPLP